MPIAKTVLDEPLLSKKQALVLREIARAAQLYQGLIELERLDDVLLTPDARKRGVRHHHELFLYLKSEIEGALSRIKVPTPKTSDQGATEQPS